MVGRRLSEPIKSERRRTRSASPAMSESTLTSVQAAFHKKQAQVHDLKTRLYNYSAKMIEYQKTNNAKDDLLKRIQDQLDFEKNQVDSMKIKMEDVISEKKLLQDKFERIRVSIEMKNRLNISVKVSILFACGHSGC